MKDIFTANVQLSPTALKLRSMRIQKGFDYKKLSDECGISVEKLVSFECDKAATTEVELSLILQALY